MHPAQHNSALQSADPAPCGVAACRVAFTVAGISFGISSHGDVKLALEPGLLPFASGNPSCDVEIDVTWTDRLELPAVPPTFESGGLWRAYVEDDGFAFYFQSAYLGSAPYKKARFDRSFRRGRVLLLKSCFDAARPVYPLEYPLDELLMIHRLSTGSGVEVHGCGVLAGDGLGRLFVGHSGAGKSTTSRLWLGRPGVCVLSDDRIILRESAGRIFMHGTPWHGDAGIAVQASGPLDRIYLIEHGQRNEIVPLQSSRSVAELFTRTFVPHHSAAGLAHVLRFIEHAVRTVPVSVFRFVPHPDAVEAILRAA